jgi:AP-3 complex subunit beta
LREPEAGSEWEGAEKRVVPAGERLDSVISGEGRVNGGKTPAGAREKTLDDWLAEESEEESSEEESSEESSESEEDDEDDSEDDDEHDRLVA